MDADYQNMPEGKPISPRGGDEPEFHGGSLSQRQADGEMLDSFTAGDAFSDARLSESGETIMLLDEVSSFGQMPPVQQSGERDIGMSGSPEERGQTENIRADLNAVPLKADSLPDRAITLPTVRGFHPDLIAGRDLILPLPKPTLDQLRARDTVKSGPDDGRGWGKYDSGLEEMERHFKDTLKELGEKVQLPFTSIREYVRRFRQLFGEQPAGLELAGQGKTFADLGINGAAIALGFPQYLIKTGSDRMRRAGTENDISFWERDIADIEKVRQIGRETRAAIIILRPVGGLYSIPQRSEFYMSLIDCLIETADPRSFLFLSQYFVSDADPLIHHLQELEKAINCHVYIPDDFWDNLAVCKF